MEILQTEDTAPAWAQDVRARDVKVGWWDANKQTSESRRPLGRGVVCLGGGVRHGIAARAPRPVRFPAPSPEFTDSKSQARAVTGRGSVQKRVQALSGSCGTPLKVWVRQMESMFLTRVVERVRVVKR